ncbi:MAG: tRNA uridine-5-carboxymethylaminomethyl(34) synthesis enzyme MnmG, partial [Burkholderiaceae bacterium]
FTSRAEFRLSLREDNADMRLTEIGRRLGCVNDLQWQAFETKREAVAREMERLRSTWVNPRIVPDVEAERVVGKALEREYSLADLLRRPQVTYDHLMTLKGVEGQALAGEPVVDPAVKEQVEIQVKYSGYIGRQAKEVERQAHYENLKMPANLDYFEVTGLSIEVKQKLSAQKPETLGQCGRISGVTPAAVSLLLVHLKKRGFKGFASEVSEQEVSAS